MPPSMVLPCAHILSAGGAHLKLINNFTNIVTGCMLPHVNFSTRIFLVEDGSEDSISVSYASALSMVHDRAAFMVETKRVQARAGRPGAHIAVAFEAGRLLASCSPSDRIIVFTDNNAIRTELEIHGIVFVSPAAFAAHEAWWVRRERSLLQPRSVTVEAIEDHIHAPFAPVEDLKPPLAQIADPVEDPTPPQVQIAEPVEDPTPSQAQITEPVEDPSTPQVQITEPVEGTTPPQVQIAEPVEDPTPPQVQIADPVEGPTPPQAIKQELDLIALTDEPCVISKRDPFESLGVFGAASIDPNSKVISYIEELKRKGTVDALVKLHFLQMLDTIERIEDPDGSAHDQPPLPGKTESDRAVSDDSSVDLKQQESCDPTAESAPTPGQDVPTAETEEQFTARMRSRIEM